jgi:hypothetical protein
MRATALLLLVACGSHGTTPAPDAAGGERVTVVEMRVTVKRGLDLLFVIDDSPGMADIQLNLAAGFPSLVDTLSTLPGGLPDLHLGVVTSDMGTSSVGFTTPAPPIGQIGNGGCSGTGKGGVLQMTGAPVTGAFISDIRLADGSRQTNYTGALADVFASMARVGAGGCGFEQPLAAMRAALDNNPANAGFLRLDALLGIVIVTDEDDCSVHDPALFDPDTTLLGPLRSFRCTRFGITCTSGGNDPDEMDLPGPKGGCGPDPKSLLIEPLDTFFERLKPDNEDIIRAAIAGDPQPVAVELWTPPGGGPPVAALAHSCSYLDAQFQTEVADPAVRLNAFVGGQAHGMFTSVCQTDQSGPLAQLGQLLVRVAGTPCLSVPLGPAPDCTVEDDVADLASDVPPCPAALPCWRIETDPTTCALADHQKLVIERTVAPNPFTITRMSCKL